jgi:hypothetical protein
MTDLFGLAVMVKWGREYEVEGGSDEETSWRKFALKYL